jgi:cytoskeleton protein RodZ
MTPQSASASASTPGVRLRKVRIERGLSIEEVARQLRLSPRVISALEEGAYERLPSPTYVRGYLRSYAMLLGLAPQQLIDEFNTSPQAAQRADMTAPTPVREAKSSDAMVRFGTVLVAGIVLGLAVLWWTGKDGSTRRRPASVTAPTASEAPRTVETPAETPVVVEAPIKATEPPSTQNERAVVSNVAPVLPAQQTPSTPPPDPNAAHLRLTIRVQEDSWADVRDAQQRRLLYETVSAGRVVSVEGAAPLSIFLGNVEGVSVEVNGQPYDALRHRRGQVARFTVGAGNN